MLISPILTGKTVTPNYRNGLLQSMLRVVMVMWLVCAASLPMACPPASQEEGCNILQASPATSHCIHFTSLLRTRACGAACVV